ncbi:hypothetical protein GCM10023144_45150 [Pigmentiphaga soli]|uniref:D-isomer specific 2-hydroxyacid dehydrogenase NAD-binding domain-containing protein n=1 Tax=Pigmentiphaga soli TaxID=1007095 RepID=A0ABP8HQK9_9BURK
MQSRRAILVSREVHDHYGSAIVEAFSAPDGSCELLPVDAGASFGDARLRDVCAGFVSVDVLGESSKDRLTPLMATFCDLLLRAPALSWVQVSSAGVDRPQYQALMRRGVTLTHAGGIASTTVAHSAIAGVLALARELPRWAALQRERRWAPARGADAPQDLDGQTALVVGLGAIGGEVARLCRTLGMRVVGFSRSGSPVQVCDEVHRIGALDAHLPAADWLILCCPLTPATRHLVGGRQLAGLPRGARIVDVSRGGVADGAALLAALQDGRLAGAYLDVFETEPLPADSPFWSLPNVIVTPHAAGDSRGRADRLVRFFLANARRLARGESLRNVASPASVQ